jgi:hypothetical protein
MIPQRTASDQAMRFLLIRCVELLYWLADLSPIFHRFQSWFESKVTFPNSQERIIDAIAIIEDHTNQGLPTAALVESQSHLDANILYRFQIGGVIFCQQQKPSEHQGDRYALMAILINLTGTGNSARSYRIWDSPQVQGTTKDSRKMIAEWTVKPIQVNLSGFSAEQTLEQVSTKKAPAEALALIPLMKNGNEDAIMQEWLGLTTEQGNVERTGILAAVVVFARLVGQFEKWSLLLKGFSMIDDPLVAEWIGQGEKKGHKEGRLEGLKDGEKKGRR